MRRVLLIMALLAAAGAPQAAAIPSTYDAQFRQAVADYLPGVDWRLLKSQCYQESLLDPLAVSPVLAKGLCQFMDPTWIEAGQALRFPPGASAFAPELSVRAAAWYMARLRAGWSAPRPEADRHSLALASYNAGMGNLLKAQRAAGGANRYAPIIAALPRVTGRRHARETTGYVQRIWGYWIALVVGS